MRGCGTMGAIRTLEAVTRLRKAAAACTGEYRGECLPIPTVQELKELAEAVRQLDLALGPMP